MRNSKWMRLLAILFAFALIAAACGDDDDDGATDGESVLGGEEEEAPAEEPEEEAPADEPEEEEEAPADEPEEVAPADEPEEEMTSEGTVSDAANGFGAEYWESTIDNPPGPADESLEPVVITMSNLEGSPAGSFPEIREGAEAAERTVNEELGGINGRPIELEVCVHGLDPAEATNCANEVADANPNFHIQGIDFFNSLQWPVYVGAGIPVLQTVPIFVSDFNTPGLLSTEGGCVSAFPGMVQYAIEDLEADAFAIVHSDTGPGLECFADTQARFYDQLEDETGSFRWQGFPDASGDPTDNDAIVQNIIEFFEGATNPGVFFGIQASDCNEILSALAGAGVAATLVASGSCRDDSVLSNPASAGVHFGGTDTIFDRPDLWSPYETKYNEFREASLDARPNQDAPKSSFMEVAHDVTLTAWLHMNMMAEAGGDIDDGAAVLDYFTTLEPFFRPGLVKPMDCSTNGEEFVSVCQKSSNYFVWSGPDGQFEFGPAGTDGVDATDLLARTAVGNPRQAAE